MIFIILFAIDAVLCKAIRKTTHSRHRTRLGRRNLDELQIWQYMISAQHVQNQIANLEEIAKNLAHDPPPVRYSRGYIRGTQGRRHNGLRVKITGGDANRKKKKSD